MAKDTVGKKGVGMVAPGTSPGQSLLPVEDLAREAGLKPWQLAGLRRACGWVEGKQVTLAEWKAAVLRFENRGMGSGKI